MAMITYEIDYSKIKTPVLVVMTDLESLREASEIIKNTLNKALKNVKKLKKKDIHNLLNVIEEESRAKLMCRKEKLYNNKNRGESNGRNKKSI